MNRAVCVLNESGERKGYITKGEAEKKVCDGAARRESARCIRLLPAQMALRGLSARVGKPLASAVYRGEAWAVVALAEINRERG